MLTPLLASLLLAAPATSKAAVDLLVLDGRTLRFRVTDLPGRLVAEGIAAEDGRWHSLAPGALQRHPEGWVVVTVPEGVRAGTLTLSSEGKGRAFRFQSSRVEPRGEPGWDAARRAECLAVAGYWYGKLRGNDPDVSATVSLEVDRDCRTVYGMLNWRSARSGQNDRVLKGSWDPKRRTLQAADVRLDQDAPAGGWRFCAIESYRLTLSPDGSRLDGAYTSKECRDEARVELARPEAARP